LLNQIIDKIKYTLDYNYKLLSTSLNTIFLTIMQFSSSLTFSAFITKAILENFLTLDKATYNPPCENTLSLKSNKSFCTV
jgi:hypothetical protein